jgi:hypothetical protein
MTMLKDLPYPLRLCVEMMNFAVHSPKTQDKKPSEIKEMLGGFFDGDVIAEATDILCGRSEKYAQAAAIQLTWSEHRKPCEEVRYDHHIAETPFGRFVLTWKGWKENPASDGGIGFDETPWGEVWYDDWHTPQDAMQAAEVELKRRIDLLQVKAL